MSNLFTNPLGRTLGALIVAGVALSSLISPAQAATRTYFLDANQHAKPNYPRCQGSLLSDTLPAGTYNFRYVSGRYNFDNRGGDRPDKLRDYFGIAYFDQGAWQEPSGIGGLVYTTPGVSQRAHHVSHNGGQPNVYFCLDYPQYTIAHNNKSGGIHIAVDTISLDAPPATPTPTPQPTPVPTPVPTPHPTPVPTPHPTPVPTPHPTPVPTPHPTPTPTNGTNVDQKNVSVIGPQVATNGSTITTTVNQKNEANIGNTTNIDNRTIVQNTATSEDKQVTVNLSDGASTVNAGDMLTWRITIKNERDRDLAGTTIRFHVPAFTVPQDSSPDAQSDVNARTITWRNQTISAGSEVTYFVKVGVAPITPNGFILHARVLVNGDGVHVTAEDTTSVRSTVQATSGVPSAGSAPIQAAPVTAATGPGALAGLASLLTVAGGLGLRTSLRTLLG